MLRSLKETGFQKVNEAIISRNAANSMGLAELSDNELNLIYDVWLAIKGELTQLKFLNYLILDSKIERDIYYCKNLAYHKSLTSMEPGINLLAKKFLWEKYPEFMKKIELIQAKVISIRLRIAKLCLCGPETEKDFFLLQLLCFQLKPEDISKLLFEHLSIREINEQLLGDAEINKVILYIIGKKYQKLYQNHFFGSLEIYSLTEFNNDVDLILSNGGVKSPDRIEKIKKYFKQTAMLTCYPKKKNNYGVNITPNMNEDECDISIIINESRLQYAALIPDEIEEDLNAMDDSDLEDLANLYNEA